MVVMFAVAGLEGCAQGRARWDHERFQGVDMEE